MEAMYTDQPLFMVQDFIIILGMVVSIIIIIIHMVFQYAIIRIMDGVLVSVLDRPIIGMGIPIGVADIIIGDHLITDHHIIVEEAVMYVPHIQFITEGEG
jgi:hypothetical protein